MNTWVLVVGNPNDGFMYVGPFTNNEDANQYGERFDNTLDSWWVCELCKPAEKLDDAA